MWHSALMHQVRVQVIFARSCRVAMACSTSVVRSKGSYGVSFFSLGMLWNSEGVGGSVAMVMTDVFHKNGIMASGKLATIVGKFVDMEHIKNQRVIYRPKRIGQVFLMLWSSHNFGQNL